MAESELIAFALGGAFGIVAAVMWWAAARLVRGSRELGTEQERTTYTTLHLASQAAKALRGRLGPTEAARAGKHLRALLGAEAIALCTSAGALAVEGGAELERGAAERVSATVFASGRAQMFRGVLAEADAVAAPVIVGDRPVAVLVAFDRRARAGLVRATTEVAQWLAAQLQLSELEGSRAALAEAQVRALRAQISPHFIYNALGAIASFITTDPERARELVLEFADFTRYSFRHHGDTTTLAEELRSIDSYLKLERARFGERLEVQLQIAPEVLPTEIPFLSLQPLVENAVRHGLEAKLSGGRVSIKARDLGAFTEIDVDDDGVGMDPEALLAAFAGEPGVEHIGLRNVDTRLRQRYGDDFGLVIETNLGSGMLVRMRVPKANPLATDAVAAIGGRG